MSRIPKLVSAVALLALAAHPALAEEKSVPFFLTPVLGGYVFDGAQNLSSGTVAGLRLAYDFAPPVALEGVAEMVDANGNGGGAKLYRFGLDGLYHFAAVSKFTPYLGAGFGAVTYDPQAATGGSLTKGIANYGGGLKYQLPEKVAAVRLDVRHLVWMGSDHYSNVEYTLGLQIPLRSCPPLPPADSDRDGIVDPLDKCPATPVGTRVDGNGCPVPLDSDKDGVNDAQDQCPNTAAGTQVDGKGCPVRLDSDKDGVIDDQDRCPGTPAGSEVDAKGCPVPLDSDKDGVVDGQDQCPATPAGSQVDGKGCPLPLDSDKDGVIDDNDQCPGTAAGVKVDAKGCPIPGDSDGDGIVDSQDQCPGTPAGVAVDPKGCPRDGDKDGVSDDRDQCPDTPAGVKVDGKGCPLDSDKDGVADHLDNCPDTAVGVKVDAKGCPVPLDSDGDGVVDSLDTCPGTAAGVKVDSKGCPVPVDSDGDGVVDEKDKCPATKRGQVVDRDGCPPPTEEQVKIDLNIKFASGKANITNEYADDLKRVGDFMVQYPGTTTEIQGYTDNVGAAAANKKLSQQRADAVRKYLIETFNIAPERLKAVGYGPEKPIADNATNEGRAKNRRIEAVIETVILKSQQ